MFLNPRLAFEVFHYVEEAVVHVWMVAEPNLHLIKVGESVLKGDIAVSKIHHENGSQS